MRRVINRLWAVMAAALLSIVPLQTDAIEDSSGDHIGSDSVTVPGSVALSSGQFTLPIEIQLPPGRAKTTPALELIYSSSGGAGPFGFGWGMTLGSINVSGADGVPLCSEGTQSLTYQLAAGGTKADLVEVSEGLFRVELDNGFMEAELDAGTNTWMVRDRAGMRYWFGAQPDAPGVPSARLFRGSDVVLDPVLCHYTTSWALTRVADPVGNTLEYHYDKVGNVLYPYEIYYGGNSEALPAVDHPFRVRFLRSPRPDTLSTNSLGVRMDMADVIDSIVVEWRESQGASFAVLRSYDLTHEHPGAGSIALLRFVDGTDLPTREFEYIDDAFGYDEDTTISSPPGNYNELRIFPRSDRAKVHRSLMDVNGDGRIDIVDAQSGSNGYWKIEYANADGGHDSGRWYGTDFEHGSTLRHSNDLDNWGTRKILWDTFDINGDGLFDRVDAENKPWRVHFGLCTDDAGEPYCRFDAPVDWPAPYEQTENILEDGSYHRTRRFMMDMNGDGLSDYVKSGTDKDTPWEVYLNTGSGFELIASPFDGKGPIRETQRWGAGTGVHTELMDMNGDGLPDQVSTTYEYYNPLSAGWVDPTTFLVTANIEGGGRIQGYTTGEMSCDVHNYSGCMPAMSVRLNNGHGFDPPVYSPLPMSPYFNEGQVDTGFLRFTRPGGDVWQDLVDMTGDGLPDHVTISSNNNKWRILENRGSGRLADDTIEFSNKFPRSSVMIQRDNFGPIRDTRDNGTKVRQEMVDWDNDGLIDRLNGGPAPWYMTSPRANTIESPLARPWLLNRAHDGLGGTIEVRYEASTKFDHTGDDSVEDLPFPVWVATAVRRTAGTCELQASEGWSRFTPGANSCGVAGQESVEEFLFHGGLYDTEEREFRGFAEVTRRTQDGVTTSVFAQDNERKGVLLSEEMRSGSVVIRRTTNQWVTQPSPLGDGRTQIYLAESRIESIDGLADGSSDIACIVNRNQPPDAWGRVSHTCSLPCAADAGMATPADACTSPVIGQIDTITTWAEPNDDETPMRERPSRIRIEYVTADGSIERLSEKIFRYDSGLDIDSRLPEGQVGAGLVKSVQSLIGPSHIGIAPSVTWTGYDALGNATKVREPRGRETEVEFDSAFSLYPVLSTTTGPSGAVYTASSVFDPRYGLPIEVTDENGQTSNTVYDSRGRIICEAIPGDSISGCQGGGSFQRTAEFLYVDAIPGAAYPGNLSYVEARRRHDDAPDGYLLARVYRDRLGRTHFKTRQQIVGDGATLETVVSDHVRFNRYQRVDRQYPPYVASGGVISASPPGAPTLIEYEVGSGAIDPLGRISKIDPPDDTIHLTSRSGRRIESTNARGDLVLTLLDDFGREVRRESGNAGSPLLVVSFTRDGMGRVLTEMVGDNPATAITYVYDNLGRIITKTDPDSGVTLAGYDESGNLVYEDTPNANQHVEQCFDDLDRIAQKCVYVQSDAYAGNACSAECGSSGIVESSYSYDETHGGMSYGIGRLTSVEDASGSTALHYDERGRVVFHGKTVRSREAGYLRTYNAAGQLDTLTYPDGEQVTYAYRADGFLGSVSSGSRVYVESLQVDVYGRTSRLMRGNGVADLYSFFDENGGAKLETLSVERESDSLRHLDLRYAYNNLGKISSVTDLRDAVGALSNDARYDYDAGGRLVEQWGTAGGNYEASYRFDALGNLTQLADANMTYSSVAPHQLVEVDGAAVTYDANGNRKSRGVHPTRGDGQSYGYSVLNRLVTIQSDADPSRASWFIYDYQGQLVYEADVNDSVEQARTYYFGDLSRGEGGYLYKRIYAGDRLIAEQKVFAPEFSTNALPVPEPAIMVLLGFGLLGTLLLTHRRRQARLFTQRCASGIRTMGVVLIFSVSTFIPMMMMAGAAEAQASPETTTHFHVDHLGSTQVLTDEAGEAIHQIRYDPYGRVRGRFDGTGSAVSAGSTTREEFGGYVTDVGSGLMFAGLRTYDSLTGQFLQHDAMSEFPSPYAFGPGDPINGRDPTGNEWVAIAFFVVALLIIVASAISTGIRQKDHVAGLQVLMFGLVTMMIGGALSAGAGAALSTAGPAMTSGINAATVGIRAGLAGYSGYSAYAAGKRGDIVGAITSALTAAMSAFGAVRAVTTAQAVSGNTIDGSVGEQPGTAFEGDSATGVQVAGGNSESDAAALQEARANENALTRARPAGNPNVQGQFNHFDVMANQELTITVQNPNMTGIMVRITAGLGPASSKTEILAPEVAGGWIGPMGGTVSLTVSAFGGGAIPYRVRIDVGGDLGVFVRFDTRGPVPTAGR